MMKTLQFHFMPKELQALVDLANNVWNDIRLPHGHVDEASRLGPNWYNLSGFFYVNTKQAYCLDVKGYEFPDRTEIFRLGITRERENPKLFDPASIPSIQDITLPENLALNKFINEKNTIFLLSIHDHVEVALTKQSHLLDVECDCGLYVVNQHARLLILTDEMPYWLRITTHNESIDEALKMVSKIQLIL